MRSFEICSGIFPRARAIEILARAHARAPCTRFRAVRTRTRGTEQNPRYTNTKLRHHGGRWCRFRRPEANLVSLSSRCESNHSNRNGSILPFPLPMCHENFVAAKPAAWFDFPCRRGRKPSNFFEITDLAITGLATAPRLPNSAILLPP